MMYPDTYADTSGPQVVFETPCGRQVSIEWEHARFCKALTTIREVAYDKKGTMVVPMRRTEAWVLGVIKAFCEDFSREPFKKPREVARDDKTKQFSIKPYLPGWACRIVELGLPTEQASDQPQELLRTFFSKAEAVYTAACTLRLDPLEALVEWRVNALLLNAGSDRKVESLLFEYTKAPINRLTRSVPIGDVIRAIRHLAKEDTIRDIERPSVVAWPD